MGMSTVRSGIPPMTKWPAAPVRAVKAMMNTLILTSVLGYELKTAVGTSVFIMAFTALTGAAGR